MSDNFEDDPLSNPSSLYTFFENDPLSNPSSFHTFLEDGPLSNSSSLYTFLEDDDLPGSPYYSWDAPIPRKSSFETAVSRAGDPNQAETGGHDSKTVSSLESS